MSDNCTLTEQEKEIMETASAIVVINDMLTKVMSDSCCTQTEVEKIQRMKARLNNIFYGLYTRRVHKGTICSKEVAEALDSVNLFYPIRYPETYAFEDNWWNELFDPFICELLRNNFCNIIHLNKSVQGRCC